MGHSTHDLDLVLNFDLDLDLRATNRIRPCQEVLWSLDHLTLTPELEKDIYFGRDLVPRFLQVTQLDLSVTFTSNLGSAIKQALFGKP